jgi:hypothetical protein
MLCRRVVAQEGGEEPEGKRLLPIVSEAGGAAAEAEIPDISKEPPSKMYHLSSSAFYRCAGQAGMPHGGRAGMSCVTGMHD